MVRLASPRSTYSSAHKISTDAWTHSQSLSGGWAHVYEQLDRRPFYGEIREAWLGPVQLIYENVVGPVRYDGHPWEGSRLFLSYLTGDLHFDNCRVTDNLLTTVRWNGVDRVTCSKPNEVVIVAVDEAFLNRFTLEAAGRVFFGDKDGSPKTYTANSTLVRQFQSAVLDVLQRVQLEPTLLDSVHQRDDLRDRILNALLSICVLRTDCDARLPRPCTRAYVVDKSIEYIESRIGENVSVADICAVVRISPRTLCYSFESVLGVSPTRYLLATRLNRVRRDILKHGGAVSLHDLASRWGIWHMGRFARYYRETFGERPSDTMKMAAQCSPRTTLRAGSTAGLALAPN